MKLPAELEAELWVKLPAELEAELWTELPVELEKLFKKSKSLEFDAKKANNTHYFKTRSRISIKVVASRLVCRWITSSVI